MEKEYKFKISNVMPVYKVEKYLREAIDSIIAQDIGFKENVQLVLVDDGSPDNCGAICDEYKEKYPENIVVIHKENGGLSSAREAGINAAEGEFIGFIDSDDIISKNTYSDVYSFFKAHKDEVTFVSIPMYFFGDITGNHPLNWKFNKGSRIIDLLEEPKAIQLSMASAFFKKEDLANLKFDYKLVKAEDAKIIVDMLLEKPKVGVVSTGKYLYRKHGADSRVGSVSQKKENYNEYVELFTKYIIDRSLEEKGEVLDFIKETAMYDLVWTIKDNFSPILTKEEEEDYKKQIKEVFQHIDDKIIYNRRHLPFPAKVHYLAMKHGKSATLKISEKSGKPYFTYDDECKISLSNFAPNIFFMNVEKDKIHLEIAFDNHLEFFKEKPNLAVKLNNKKHKPNKVIERHKKPHYLGDVAFVGNVYFFDIPLNEKAKSQNLEVLVSFDNKNFYPCENINFAEHCGLSKAFYRSYFTDGKYLFKRCGNDKISITKNTFCKRVKSEIEFLLSILKTPHKHHLKIFALRLYYDLTKPFCRKPVWLVSDRLNKAGDNGEAFFRYMMKNKDKSIKCYYTIDKCPDFYMMKKVGPVVDKKSFKSHILHLRAKNIISSHADPFVYNPYGIASEGFKDIMTKRNFIFLQHGVTKDDISSWLNKYNKNIKGFITSAKNETKSILDYDFFYEEDRVWETGMPRFDRLEDKREKIITLMPTWRRYLVSHYDRNGIWVLKPDYTSSKYYTFYNSIINNKKLLNVAEKHGYKFQFMPHPNLIPHIGLFEKDDRVEFLNINTPYKDIYAKSALILTDFSSAVFDFAYLRKPVMYAHFDKDEFFAGEHVYTQGYFDYERDGFGEVAYNLDETIKLLIDYIENDCKLKDKYAERINNFFAFDDRNNSERVYKKIKELK